MRWPFAMGSLLVALVVPRPAAAVVVELDAFGTYTSDLFAACAMGAVTETANGLLSFGPSGLGVSSPAGGMSAYLDGSESLSFFFPSIGMTGVTQLTYRVQAAGNQNGAGPHGEAFLTAVGADNVDLGVRSVSGVGTIDVSALYGGQPITRLDITAAGDAQRVDRLVFTVAPAEASALVALKGFGVVQAPVYEVCDLAISGSHDVRLAPVGLGVASASPPSLLDSLIEGSEFVRFDLATAYAQITYQNEAVGDANANGVVAESFVEGYDASGASLGIVPVSGAGLHDVTGLFEETSLSGFRVIANGDGQRVVTVQYSPEPEALGLGLAAFASLARARRRASSPS